MKKLLLLAALPTLAFAVDYSRCPMPSEVSVTPEGKVEASSWYDIKNVKTEGRVSTYTLKSKNGHVMMSHERKIVVTRDEQDRIVNVKVDGDKPSKEVIEAWRQVQQAGGMVGGSYGGGGYGYGGSNSVTIHSDGKSREVPLNQISDKDLADLGVKGIKAQEVRTGSSEWSRSAQTQRHLKEISQKSRNQFPVSIYVGSNYNFSHHEGACVPERAASLFYTSQNDSVSEFAIYDRENCQKIEAVVKKHSAKITECTNYENNELSPDIQRLAGEGAFNTSGMGYVGGYPGGGLVGGMNGGGYGGGYGFGMGMGGYGPINEKQMLGNMDYFCKSYGNLPQWGGGMVGGSTGGYGSGGSSEQ